MKLTMAKSPGTHGRDATVIWNLAKPPTAAPRIARRHTQQVRATLTRKRSQVRVLYRPGRGCRSAARFPSTGVRPLIVCGRPGGKTAMDSDGLTWTTVDTRGVIRSVDCLLAGIATGGHSRANVRVRKVVPEDAASLHVGEGEGMNATPIHAPPRLSPGQQAADQHQPGRRLRAARPATHVDHVIARVRGGGDDPANLRAACRSVQPVPRRRAAQLAAEPGLVTGPPTSTPATTTPTARVRRSLTSTTISTRTGRRCVPRRRRGRHTFRGIAVL